MVCWNKLIKSIKQTGRQNVRKKSAEIARKHLQNWWIIMSLITVEINGLIASDLFMQSLGIIKCVPNNSKPFNFEVGNFPSYNISCKTAT